MDKETLLMVIDVQKDLFNKTKKVFNEQKIIENINTIINVFREKDLPIIFIKHTNDGSMKENSDGWQFHPNLKVNDNDLVLMKRVSSSLREKAIINKIRELGVSKLVVVGLVTHGCIKSVVLDAIDMGFDITVVGDAHSNYSDNAEEIIKDCNRIFIESGAIVKTTNEVIKEI